MQNKNGKRVKRVKREQPRKDSRDKRVNYDNTRESKFDKDIADDAYAKSGKANDIKWYSRNPEMLKSAASIGFSSTVGFPTPMDTAIPGLMTIGWAPSLGGDNIVAVNQAKESYYSFVVHENSRNKSYDSNDLMLVTIAGANLLSYMSYLFRLYGLLRRASEVNAYYPKALIYANGVDYNDLLQHQAQMWFDLNELVARSAQIWIPNDLPFVARWFWLNANVYTDGSSDKAQSYMFVPSVFYKYDATAFQDGGALVPVTVKYTVGEGDEATINVRDFNPFNYQASYTSTTANRQPYTWQNLMDVANEMFDGLLNSQDRGIMFGDILKAYGKDKLYAVNELQVNYTVVPVYDPEVLTQIENATIRNDFPKLVFKQDMATNSLVEAVVGTGGMSNDQGWPNVLNMHQNAQPTPEQVMIATRLANLGTTTKTRPHVSITYADGVPTYVSDTASITMLDSTGTEVAVGLAIHVLTRSGNSVLANPPQGMAYVVANYGVMKQQVLLIPGSFNFSTASSTAFQWIDLYTQFDWAPMLYNRQTTTSNPTWYGMLADLEDYVFVEKEDIKKTHTCAVYSEFGVPIL